MIYLELFLAFLQIGALSFGGGYAAMPLIQAQAIDKYHWISMADFTSLITISEMTPGPIAVNAATFVGTQTAGILGGLVATAGCILPSCIFVTLLAWLYAKYKNLALMQGVLHSLRPAVLSMILTAGITILLPVFFAEGLTAPESLRIRGILLFLGALLLLRRFKLDPIKCMVFCGLAEAACRLAAG